MQFFPQISPMAASLSTETFYESRSEESNSSEVSCHISSCGNGDLGGAGLQAIMRGFGGVFDLDVGLSGSSPMRQSGMQVNMQAKQNSSKSCSVREGRKLNMAVTMDPFGWSDDSSD